jgi:hypothetical protein
MAMLEWSPPPTDLDPIWWPISAQQQTALHSTAQILLYGGASGGGKTDFLVWDAQVENDNANLRALLIRRSFAEMGQIQDRCRALYSPQGAFWREREHSWVFPSGARVRLGFMANDNTISKYQGNPFTWLGIDESTMLPEKQFRDILPWLTTVDPSLYPRARLTTNPGGVGAAWHLHVFLRDKCPIHYPAQSVRSGSIYSGSRWMSDKELVKKTVSFIHATVESNPLYGQDKIDSLESQTAERREQLLTGCWCKLEGMFFTFLNETFKRPVGSLVEPWWATHFMGMDYGMSGSAAASGLYYPEESGVVYKVAECVERKLGSTDYAEEVVKQFVTGRQLQGNRPRVSACYYDPAMDAHTGTGKSNAELIQEVFDNYDIPMIKAAKDRIGNAQQTYTRLRNKTFMIMDTCPKTWSSFRSRMHDPKMSGAVLKVKTEDLDDVYDETTYALNTWFESSVKPEEEKAREKLREMQESGLDQHSLHIHATRLSQQIRQGSDQPARMGNRKGVLIQRR